MFTGSIVALVTPMKEDGSLDFAALERLLDWHLESGTDGLVIAGTTGESAVLGEDEYRELLAVAVSRVAGRCPLIAGCGGPSTEKVIETVRLARRTGADAALIVTPYYNRPPQAGLVAHYKAISAACDLPQILYNVPTRTGVDLRPDSIARLYQLDNIVAFKEANPEPGRMVELVKRFGDRLVLLSGDDPTALESLRAGARGVISVANNLLPHRFARMVKAALDDDFAAAARLDASLQPLYAALALTTNPIAIKWALYKSGKIGCGIRLPLIPLEEKYHPQLAEVLELRDTE